MNEKNLEWNVDMEGVKLFVGLANYIYDYVNLMLSNFDDRKYIEDLLENQGGMKYLIRDMYNNSDKRFISLYKDKFVNKLGLDKASRSTKYSKRFDYFTNLYSLFEAYRFNKDDYDNFEAIVSDIIPDSLSNVSFSTTRKSFIDAVVRNKCYKNLPELRRFFKDIVLKEDDKELFDAIPYYKSMLKLVEKVIDNDYKNKNRIKVANKVIGMSLNRNSFFRVNLFYDDVLLFGNRFSYINDKLNEIEDNELIRNQIFSRIKSLNDKLFLYLNNLIPEKDSFIICMDMIFDSDSYKEMLNKLDALDRAGFEYKLGDYKFACEVIKRLNTCEYKECIDGTIVKCDSSKVKPKKIIDRMKKIYVEIDNSKTEEFINKVHDSSVNINSFYIRLGELKRSESLLDNECNVNLEDGDFVSFDFDVRDKFKGLLKRFMVKKDK